MKKLILSATCFLSCICLFGQTVDYIAFEYDNAGNRTERNVIYLRASEESKAQEIESVVQGAESNAQKSSSADVYTELLGEQEISIFPNPTKGKLTIEVTNLERGEPASLEVYSLAGKRVLHKDKIRSKTKVDLSKQPPGAYVLKIMLGAQLSTWKVIKE